MVRESGRHPPGPPLCSLCRGESRGGEGGPGGGRARLRADLRRQPGPLCPGRGGGPERRLTDDPAVDALPRWSRDGTRVIFSSKRTGEWQLYEVGAEGGPARRLRTNQAVEYQADESPDGRWLAFLSNLEGAEWLWLWAGGRRPARASSNTGAAAVLGNPHWSPDGKRIVFSSNWRVGPPHLFAGRGHRQGVPHVAPSKGGASPASAPTARRSFTSAGGTSRRRAASSSTTRERQGNA